MFSYPLWPAALLVLDLVVSLSCPASASALLAPRWQVDSWVTIDSDGQPHTLTPSVTTTENGVVSTITGAPYLLTGSVFAMTSDGSVSAVTTSPPPTTATAASGADGFFAVCNNGDGDGSPFCQPRGQSQLSVNKTYYSAAPDFLSFQAPPFPPGEESLMHRLLTSVQSPGMPITSALKTLSFNSVPSSPRS